MLHPLSWISRSFTVSDKPRGSCGTSTAWHALDNLHVCAAVCERRACMNIIPFPNHLEMTTVMLGRAACLAGRLMPSVGCSRQRIAKVRASIRFLMSEVFKKSVCIIFVLHSCMRRFVLGCTGACIAVTVFKAFYQLCHSPGQRHYMRQASLW